jgi:signal recognition particle receptor subunit beta
MVLFNYSTKELTAKVVYYGPGLCGKTTNLQWIHEKLPIKNKGKMLSLATETDRTLFFDFLPIEIGAIRGMKTRIQLYTVPGQVFYNATRRMVLKGADAVVFVCDSQEAMLDANLESFENMRQNLEANEIDPDEIPTVFQFNKRDLPNALPIEILNERMNPRDYPFHEAIAVTGVGVEDTLKTVTKLVFKSLSVKYGDAGTSPPAPGPRAPAPPRAATAPAAAAAPPPAAPLVDGEEEDLLGQLAPEPAAPPAASLPPVVVDEEHTPAAALGVPSSPPSSIKTHDPEGTLVSKRNEADELRQRIANPGIPENEIEMDLEEIVEVDDAAHGSPELPSSPTISGPGTAPVAPRPAEVEVPIDIELAPGTTRVNLTLRLVLNLKQR